MRKSCSFFLIPLPCLALVAGACSSSKPAPVTPTPVVDAGSNAGMFGSDASVGVATMPATDAAAPPFFTGDAGGMVAAIGDQALDTVIDLAITTASSKAAPKMDKEGAAGVVKQSNRQHLLITMKDRLHLCTGSGLICNQYAQAKATLNGVRHLQSDQPRPIFNQVSDSFFQTQRYQ